MRKAFIYPTGLGANFVEFVPGPSEGALQPGFEGTGGVVWRVIVALTPANGRGSPTVVPMTLAPVTTGSPEVSGFGTRWSKAALMPTIATGQARKCPTATVPR